MLTERILVALDGSHRSEAVLQPLLALTEGSSASLFLLHVVERVVEYPDGETEAFEKRHTDSVMDAARGYLESLREPLQKRGLEVSLKIAVGKPHAVILEEAERLQATLIALTSRGRGVLPGLRLGSVAARVLTASPVPVLVVRPERRGKFWVAPRRLRSLLVPLDGSRTAEAALPYARELALNLKLPVTLATVLPAPVVVALGDESIILWEAQSPGQRRLEGRARDYLSSVASRLRADGLQVECQVALGPAASGILYWANRYRPCLIVMCTGGHSGPGRWLGGVTEEVVRRSHMPVLALPPPAR